MTTPFKVFFDKLRGKEPESIDLTVSSEFLDVKEEELSFMDPVKVKGEAYITDGHLVLHLKISATSLIPCLVCNETVKTPIHIDNFYLAEPLDEMKGAFFTYEGKLRDAILLQVPFFAECNNGHCPERERLSQFFKKNSKDDSAKNSDYHPFSNLDS